MLKLSILICSLKSRIEMRRAMLAVLVSSLGECEHELVEEPNYTLDRYSNDTVEVIICTDEKQMTVGAKRNLLVSLSSGEYLTELDDDDRIESSYKRELLEATKSDADVITFCVSVSLNGNPAKLCFYSKDYKGDYNDDNHYYRLPNHLMCVKKKLAIQVPFVELNFGEDADYARRLKPLLRSEFNITKVLYHYDFNSQTTETQNKSR